MIHPNPTPDVLEPSQNRWPTYIAVLLVEAVVVTGLWAFGLYFSS